MNDAPVSTNARSARSLNRPRRYQPSLRRQFFPCPIHCHQIEKTFPTTYSFGKSVSSIFFSWASPIEPTRKNDVLVSLDQYSRCYLCHLIEKPHSLIHSCGQWHIDDHSIRPGGDLSPATCWRIDFMQDRYVLCDRIRCDVCRFSGLSIRILSHTFSFNTLAIDERNVSALLYASFASLAETESAL